MNTLAAALAWHHLGIATIPIRARDKRPALEQWRRYMSEMPRLHDLNVWFGSGRYNIAVVTGWRGLVVLDFDDLGTWAQSMYSLPETYIVRTARGVHLYFYCREDTETTKGSGWDVKAAGGYVLASPSVHPSGHTYYSWGRPENIAAIASIWDFVEKPAPPEPVLNSRSLDPWDAAMQPDGPGVSIDEIKRLYPLTAFLGLPAGRRRMMIRCPLPGHDDRNASFAVFPDEHFFCYGCQRHGDVIDLVALLQNITTAEAMTWLTNH